MGLPVIGAGILAADQLFGGIAQGEQAHYQAQVAKNNSITETQNAQYAASAGAAQVEQAGLKAAQKSSGLKASQAASGLDVNSGSPVDVQTSERELGFLDAKTVANNAAVQTYGYETQAVNDKAQEKLYNTESIEAPIGGALSAGGSLAGNASVDSLFSSGGGSATGGAQTFGAGATGAPTSLISGLPSVPDSYSWMQDSEPRYGGVY